MVFIPEAWIVCCTTVLQHDKSWDDAIDRVVNSVKDEKISHFLFSRNGVATPGHPRIPEQFEMAQEWQIILKMCWVYIKINEIRNVQLQTKEIIFLKLNCVRSRLT